MRIKLVADGQTPPRAVNANTNEPVEGITGVLYQYGPGGQRLILELKKFDLEIDQDIEDMENPTNVHP
jgi:hypothetical protein